MSELPETMSPELAKAARETTVVLYDLIGQWNRGDYAPALDRIEQFDVSGLRSLVLGLLGFSVYSLAAIAQTGGVDFDTCLAMCTAATMDEIAKMETP